MEKIIPTSNFSSDMTCLETVNAILNLRKNTKQTENQWPPSENWGHKANSNAEIWRDRKIQKTTANTYLSSREVAGAIHCRYTKLANLTNCWSLGVDLNENEKLLGATIFEKVKTSVDFTSRNLTRETIFPTFHQVGKIVILKYAGIVSITKGKPLLWSQRTTTC